MAWAYFCWRDGGGLVFASLSLAVDVADFCGCRVFGGLPLEGQNDRGGLPRPRRCCGGLLTGGVCVSAAARKILESVNACNVIDGMLLQR
ncbi:hypothetical protein NDU88_002352 [Pleurodeles waltl]|uniref:Secreted protein n=1 Tax=Pleurodeles waltl TaxID=8319 RepID=A0AAV7T2B2_PLEWA|nr:hypothetical protein NDU88_002352 [Pleurodeles waltl]